jgi:hypothetical protein
MYRNSLFPKVVDIGINLITSTVAVARGGPFGQTKTQTFEMNRVNSAANITKMQHFSIQTIRNLKQELQHN